VAAPAVRLERQGVLDLVPVPVPAEQKWARPNREKLPFVCARLSAQWAEFPLATAATGPVLLLTRPRMTLLAQQFAAQAAARWRCLLQVG